MAQVDFYILSDSSKRNINQMVCRLCEKALEKEMQVFVYTCTDQQAQILDELLWTYKSDSFIPHCIISDDFLPVSPAKTENFNYPVVIKAVNSVLDQQLPAQFKGLLINLSQTIPPFMPYFERIAEMVDKDETEKQLARERYRLYRQQNHTLNKYDL